MDQPGTRSTGVLSTLGKLLAFAVIVGGLVLVVHGEGWVAGAVALGSLLVLGVVVRDISQAAQAAEAHRRAHHGE